jgi:hypothetical protein
VRSSAATLANDLELNSPSLMLTHIKAHFEANPWIIPPQRQLKLKRIKH